MGFVTVFRHVPPPIIGTIGRVRDRSFQAFEATLDWLETTGVLVERFDPATAPAEVGRRKDVQQLIKKEGGRCLPIVLVNEVVVSKGAWLSRAPLARLVGQTRRRRTRSAA